MGRKCQLPVPALPHADLGGSVFAIWDSVSPLLYYVRMEPEGRGGWTCLRTQNSEKLSKGLAQCHTGSKPGPKHLTSWSLLTLWGRAVWGDQRIQKG